MLLNAPPSSPVKAWVKRSVPRPCESVGALQVNRGPVLFLLPEAVRQAKLLPPALAVGRDTDPTGPSTVLSWNGWLNRTVPAADARGACTAIPMVTKPITSITATAGDTVRLASGQRTILRLLSRVASLVLKGAVAFR